MRDGDSINFQKASCTLDGCVKIYSSRVDSVAEQTGKLLTGLSGDDTKIKQLQGDANEQIGEESEGVRPKRSNSHKGVETLEKNMENLTLKQVEQECAADPLFKKMCSQFDELSGVAGMLQLISPLKLSDFSIIFDSPGEKENQPVHTDLQVSAKAIEALGNS